MSKVSIILPTYNERDNIQELIPKIFRVFKKNKISGEVIVVDDSSPDGTSQVVRELQKKHRIKLIERNKKLGIGSAYILGFKKAFENNSKIVFEMDADLSHSPSDIPKFLEKMNEFDVVVGSRKTEGGGVIGWNFYRKLISHGGNFIGKYIAGVGVNDLTSGFRAYKSNVLKEILLDKIESEGYGFQLEMLARVLKKRFKIGIIPIIFRDRHSGSSKLSRKDIIHFFIIAVKIRLDLLR